MGLVLRDSDIQDVIFSEEHNSLLFFPGAFPITHHHSYLDNALSRPLLAGGIGTEQSIPVVKGVRYRRVELAVSTLLVWAKMRRSVISLLLRYVMTALCRHCRRGFAMSARFELPVSPLAFRPRCNEVCMRFPFLLGYAMSTAISHAINIECRYVCRD